MRPEVIKAIELMRSTEPERVEHALSLLRKTVFSLSKSICAHHEDAEDNSQEVLLKLVPYLERFDNPKALTTWLHIVARNCWLMSNRKNRFAPKKDYSLDYPKDARERSPLEAIAIHAPSPEDLAIMTEESHLLRQAISRLRPRYRLMVVLHDLEELSTDRVASMLRVSNSNVRVRLHRSRRMLRDQLSNQ
jgi:RNA polymerase sigma-70 factor (ECF subfamily)